MRPVKESGIVGAIAGVWFALALLGSWRGIFRKTSPAKLLLAGCVIPASIYFAALRYSVRFRRFVLRQDLRRVTLLQVSRLGGVIFFIAYERGALPGVFAIPTGITDMVIGATAPLVASRVRGRRPGRAFYLWHVTGLIWMTSASTLGMLTSPGVKKIASANDTSREMTRFPFSLVPTFLGPMTLILHLVALNAALGRSGNRRGV
jgi:hypothetical protein